jgi:transposase
MARLQGRFKDDSFYSFSRDNQQLKVFYGGELMMNIDLENQVELRRAIIFFLKIEVSINFLSNTFGIARQTIKQWYAIYKKDGFDALLNFRKGPKKINDEIRAYIIAKFKDLDFCRNYKQIICEKVCEHFGTTIHWRSVSEILTRSGIDLSVKRYNHDSRKKQRNLSATPTRHTSSHAGLFFIYPFLVSLGIEKLFSDVRGVFENARYGVMEYIYGLLFLFASNKITVEENIKMHDEKELESVLGKDGLPSLRSFRSYVPKIIAGINLKEFEYLLARNYYTKHASSSELYIDGHFMPYHGKYETFKGYNPIRRFAEKGRVGYFINSNEGRPFFYILSDGYKDFREYLREIAQNITRITQEKRNKEVILVFDRGGWGADFCEELGGVIRFICWRRGKAEVPAGAKWEQIEIEKKTNEYGVYKKEILEACETVETSRRGVKRYIFIRRKEGKVSLAYSNDPERNLGDLVRILTRRWGLQENIFKGLKGVGIDKISSYQIEDYPENWLLEESEEREVANPQRLIIEERMAAIKGDVKRLMEEAGALPVKKGKKGMKKRMKLDERIEEKKIELEKLRLEKERVPEKVSINEIIEAKDIVRLNSDKKKFFDLMKVLSYNVQQDVVDAIRPIYKNERDVNMFVRQLFDRDGAVEMGMDKILITFRPYRSKKKNDVLNFLIEKINAMEIRHPLINLKIVFGTV